MSFPSKETAIQKISILVERFDDQKEVYRNASYNETLTRQDFINPFFKALGWDVDNEQGYAESYREVIHEDKIKIGGAMKAPDYSFRLGGGKRLFFVEAKKPSVLIKDDMTPAYQVRRYGWSAKLPISIITDFEEFAIYDCSKKPLLTDKASNGRIKYLTYSNYLSEFDFIWDTFSKEKVLKGSFDKFIQNDKNKRGTTTVDHEFLQSLDNWRTYLATSIAVNNKNLNEEELNFAVQQIIDRIIFLRIAEDRSVEQYGNLQDAIKSGNYYQNLLRQFHIADQKYNSGLFDFKKDKISDSIALDNKVIKTVINDLYYPISPYEFSVLSVEILGSAYEQFLGKKITLSKTGKAIISEKPEVRKAGGVYYTPQYIVDYIVKNTIGKLVENKTPKDISKLKIVDPACGSGSFLIGAFQFLLDFHKDYYTNNGKPSKGHKENPLTPDGNLTTTEKKRILLNNIYGVDLDANAVEVTKLSLLLKCMEGETEFTIASQLRLFHERILPTLDNNIKSGNSLIDTDFYSTELDFGEERKIKPFSWQKAFPEVFKQGGFDCVIGNPPYIQMVMFDWFDDNQKEYLLKKFCSSMGRMNTFGFFIEQGINLVTKNGMLGYIIPNTILTQEYYQEIRNLILNKTHIENIVSYEKFVFADAVVETTTLILSKKKSVGESDITFLDKEGNYTSKKNKTRKF
ncbi:Eco57I restriction-modification methylase domain-containing protein [Ferruginibacter sp.]|nr:N-6 DNA methylase [Ferruginibacter sp.]